MNIGEVLQKADALYPNHCSIREKLGWCSDVSHTIRNEVNPRYDFIKTTAQQLDDTIAKIGEDRVQSVITKNGTFAKASIRSYGADGTRRLNDSITGDVTVVYMVRAKGFRYVRYEGRVKIKDNIIAFDKKHNFENGDTLIIDIPDFGKKEIHAVLEGKSIRAEGEKLDAYSGEAVIEKKLCDELECEPPYDYMYVDYLLGKLCFYQNDFDAANRHMAQYNNKIALYQRFVKARDAYASDAHFRGYWT